LKKLPALLIAIFLCAGRMSAQPATPLDALQGGENIASAFIITGPLPFNSTGSTAGHLDDYDEACPYTSSAPDVVYSYTPASNITVDIDLCGSAFDTKVFVYENSVTPGVPYDCNDDYYTDPVCGYYVSKIESLYLAAGNTYYIVIDGYDGSAFGNYSLAVSDNSPPPACTWGVDIICPPGAVSENETCGTNTNGGCTMPPGTETWVTVPGAGSAYCGTLWANGGTRDSDMYKLVLTQATQVIMTADADKLVQYGLMTGGTGGYGGNPTCAGITGTFPINTAGPCNETILDLGLLSPGTYWFSVSLTVLNGLPCDNHYWIDFDVIPQPCPTPVDLTALNITASTAQLAWTESGTATSWEYQLGAAGFTPALTGTATSINPKPVSGLSANTAYDFYVRSSCNPAFSDWEGPYSFTTLCGSVSTVPWAEGFEATWPPSCWTDAESADYGWSHSTYGSARSGSGWAFCNLAGSVLSTPQLSLATNSSLSFWFRVEHAGFPQDLTVKIGNSVLYQITGATNEVFQQISVSLADFTGQTVSISFIGETGNGGLLPGICLDDVSVNSFNTWTGNSSITWNNNGNWSKGTIPVQSDPVLIPSAPAGNQFPVIQGGITAKCYFIWVAPGATLRVLSGSTLDVKNP
jgi:hypothetical protein